MLSLMRIKKLRVIFPAAAVYSVFTKINCWNFGIYTAVVSMQLQYMVVLQLALSLSRS